LDWHQPAKKHPASTEFAGLADSTITIKRIKNMSLQYATEFRDSFPQCSKEYRSMDCFLRYARGHNNPMSKSVWAERMEEMGCPVSIGFLERRIIRPARRIYDFFGVSRFRGLFVMIDNDDIEHSAQFYHEQGDSMYCRGDILSSRLNASRGRLSPSHFDQLEVRPHLALPGPPWNDIPEGSSPVAQIIE